MEYGNISIRKYMNKKRQTMTMALLLALSASVKAQYVTYNHDESVQNQVTIQEIQTADPATN